MNTYYSINRRRVGLQCKACQKDGSSSCFLCSNEEYDSDTDDAITLNTTASLTDTSENNDDCNNNYIASDNNSLSCEPVSNLKSDALTYEQQCIYHKKGRYDDNGIFTTVDFFDLPFEHVDSFELLIHKKTLFRKKAAHKWVEDEASSDEDNYNDDEDETDEEEDDDTSILERISNPSFVGFTDHIRERMYERGYTQSDFNMVIKHGCRVQEGKGGAWRFIYNRTLVVTDRDVEVGITMYEEDDTNCEMCDLEQDMCVCGFCKLCCEKSGKRNPCCPNCRRRGKEICDRGFCQDCCFGCDTCAGEECPNCKVRGEEICKRGFCNECCWGCDTCAGEQCPKCKVKAMNLLCDKGLCPKCCDGCMTCSGEHCPQCGDEGMDILCNRGFCNKCCWGCSACR